MKNTLSSEFVDFYASSFSEVRGYFLRRRFSEADAEDLTQETFARATADLDSLKDPEKMRAWVFVTAANVLRREIRDRRRRIRTVTFSQIDQNIAAWGRFHSTSGSHEGGGDPFEGSHGRTPELHYVRREGGLKWYGRIRRVRRAISTMPRQMRDCTVLRHFAGLKIRVIAERLGMSMNAVKVQLHRANERLGKLA